MKYGLRQDTISVIQNVFDRHEQIESAILFGSRAKGNYHGGSDIDITLTGNSLDFSLQLKVENELDDLYLPYKIDLSIFHKIENKDLIDHIKRVGKVFYQRRNHTPVVKQIIRAIPEERENTKDRFRVKFGDKHSFDKLEVTIIRKKTGQSLVYQFSSDDLPDNDSVHFSTFITGGELVVQWDQFISPLAKFLSK